MRSGCRRCESRESVNLNDIRRLARDLTASLDPPGCWTAFVDHPLCPSRSIEVAIVSRHRFAFYYWLKWWNKDDRLLSLVTMDWHNDVGGTSDFDPKVIRDLDLSNSNEMALFCWAGSRSLDDGHIAPALYRGAFQRVDVINKQSRQDGCLAVEKQTNCDGEVAEIRFHRCPADFAKWHRRQACGTEIVFDLDLDYFTVEHPSRDLGKQRLQPESYVHRVLDPQGELMSQLLPEVRRITIALEPYYCGGLSNCLRLLDLVSDTLFGCCLKIR